MDKDARTSRIPGFYSLSLDKRLEVVARHAGLDVEATRRLLEHGGLTLDLAERMVENVIGTFALPYAVATNFIVNGREVLVPMVTEEPSVVAAASHGAKMAREGGGFFVEVSEPLMAVQVQVFTRDVLEAKRRLEEAQGEIISEAAATNPRLLAHGGGPKTVEVRPFETQGFLVLHLYVDCRDAMGANIVNTMGEAIGPIVERISGGKVGLKILTNLADRRLVRGKAFVPDSALAIEGTRGDEVGQRVVEASKFAEEDPYRAVTHNKGIMNGVDAVVIATGNDFRAVEAGAHGFAARKGKVEPLCIWRKVSGGVEGTLEMPMQVGSVGGATTVHPLAELSLRILGAKSWADVAAAAAAAGMANNLAALKALVTEGIQKGHMALHRRARGPSRPS